MHAQLECTIIKDSETENEKSIYYYFQYLLVEAVM